MSKAGLILSIMSRIMPPTVLLRNVAEEAADDDDAGADDDGGEGAAARPCWIGEGPDLLSLE